MPETKETLTCPFCGGEVGVSAILCGPIGRKQGRTTWFCADPTTTHDSGAEFLEESRPTEAAQKATIDALVEAAQNMIDNGATDPADLPENSWYNDCKTLSAAIKRAGG